MVRSVTFAVPFLLPLLGLACAATSAIAQSASNAVGTVVDTPEREPEDLSGFNVVALPIPVTNAAIGNGLGVAGAFLYKLDADSSPSYTGVGALYTQKNSWAFGAMQKANFDGDRIHISAMAARYFFNYDFFGVGEASGGRGVSVPLTQSGNLIIPEFLYRVVPNIFVGLRFRYLTADTSIDLTQVNNQLHLSLPSKALSITSSGLGPVVEYDSRDNAFSPTKGFYARIESNFAARSFLTNTKSYAVTDGFYNGYHPISEKAVLAYRFSACDVSNTTPFFDLCSFGENSDLRGYTPGQYRDKTSFAAQAEYRWQFWDPFGLVVFGGVGGVAPSFGDYQFDKLLPSGGAGLRYLASEKYHVNVGIDFAWGKHSSAYNFRIGEAF